jgi:hypothetical protein
MNYYTYTIAQHWVCAIENDDYSGLEDNEIEELKSFLDTLPNNTMGWDWSEEGSFARDEISGLMAQCFVGTLFITEDETSCKK